MFSRLLSLGLGHLIDQFYKSNILDIYIERGEEQNYHTLRSNLTEIGRSTAEVDSIIEEFQNTRWAYCPLTIELHMERGLENTSVIVPFCRKEILSNKGSTASVYWVVVKKDLITDAKLREVLHSSLRIDAEFGEVYLSHKFGICSAKCNQCYQMALKSFCGNKKTAYSHEKDAFSGLKADDAVPIIRYIGCYTHGHGEGADRKRNHTGTTCNLLLEFGEQDLYEYWQDASTIPPVRTTEIVDAWRSLFEVADAIRHIHDLQLLRDGGDTLKFHGYHTTKLLV